MNDDIKDQTSRINSVDKIMNKDIDESRFKPVAKISKFFHKPLLSVNSHYIAYPTSRPGIVRVIDQEDGNHIALNTADFNAGSAISILELKEVSSTETVLMVCSPDVIIWKFQHGVALESQCAGVNISKSLVCDVSTICTANIWPTKSNTDGPKLIIGTNDFNVIITECDGRKVNKTTVDSLPDHFGLGDYPNVAIITEEKSIYHWSGTEKAQFAVKSPIEVISVCFINNSQALVTGINEILVIPVDSPAYEAYGVKIPDTSIKKSVFLAPYLIATDSIGNLLIIQLAPTSLESQSIKFDRVVQLKTGLNIYDISITKSLNNSSAEIIDVHILHSGGLHILSIKKDDLSGISLSEATGSKIQTISRTPSPAMKPVSNSPKLKSTTSSPALKEASSLISTPGVNQSNGASMTSSPLISNTPRAPSYHSKASSKRSSATKDNTKNLLESYSRENFKEKTYTMSELLTSGQFVLKSEYDQMQEKFMQNIHRLEQKITHFDKKLDHVTTQLSLLSKRERKEKEKEKEKKTTSGKDSVDNDFKRNGSNVGSGNGSGRATSTGTATSTSMATSVSTATTGTATNTSKPFTKQRELTNEQFIKDVEKAKEEQQNYSKRKELNLNRIRSTSISSSSSSPVPSSSPTSTPITTSISTITEKKPDSSSHTTKKKLSLEEVEKEEEKSAINNENSVNEKLKNALWNDVSGKGIGIRYEDQGKGSQPKEKSISERGQGDRNIDEQSQSKKTDVQSREIAITDQRNEDGMTNTRKTSKTMETKVMATKAKVSPMIPGMSPTNPTASITTPVASITTPVTNTPTARKSSASKGPTSQSSGINIGTGTGNTSTGSIITGNAPTSIPTNINTNTNVGTTATAATSKLSSPRPTSSSPHIPSSSHLTSSSPISTSPHLTTSPSSSHTFESHVFELTQLLKAGLIVKLNQSAKQMMKQFDFKQIDNLLPSTTDNDTYRSDLIILSAISCLCSLTTIDDNTNQWIQHLLQQLDLSEPQLYNNSKDDHFINNLIKKIKQQYIDIGGSTSNILIKLNYYEKITL